MPWKIRNWNFWGGTAQRARRRRSNGYRSKQMRIAQIAPLAESVPPKLYGGTERVVAWLVDELVSLGHDVTLFASGDSVTKAELNAVCPRALRLGRPRTDPMALQAALLEEVADKAKNFDLIHSHIDWLHLPLLSRLGVPFLTTCHGRMDLPLFPEVIRRFPNAAFVSISENQRMPLSEANWVGTVYHGLPHELFQPVARAVGMPLHIAAKVPRGETTFFKEVIEPQVDGKQVRLIGEVNDRAKQGFLANAAALLFPIDWPEPFGLVMIEAMACGTPVIAFRSGSVPEVVDDGITGFVVSDEQEAIHALGRLGKLNRPRVRAQFKKRFSSRRMTEDYLSHFRALTVQARKAEALARTDRSSYLPPPFGT
jgi:glycosyltransferase involved in cell wall biosynthesis